MLEVWVVVEAQASSNATSTATSKMVAALDRAVTTYQGKNATVRSVRAVELETLYSKYLYRSGNSAASSDAVEVILCPLTLNLPSNFSFHGQEIYQACRDVVGLRRLVEERFKYPSLEGCFWLPIVLTGKGPLYGEAIGLGEGIAPQSYYQPVHLSDALRQGLYKLGHQLLRSLKAPQATYLVQFGLEGENIYFDRLWPFPAAPAIASIGVQSPDLFVCHWHCLTNMPLYDMAIVPRETSVVSY